MLRRGNSKGGKGLSTKEDEVAPATLPNTPESFPIKEGKLIEMAKDLFDKGVGLEDPDALDPEFRFEFPIVSLNKERYLEAVRSFKLKEAFRNLDPHPYDWRVDLYEPNRVWFTVRNTATHTGTLRFLNTYKATGRVVLGAPECMSLIFNNEGKCITYTGGYVMDRRVGNTRGLGGMFGILAAIGGPVLKPGSFTFFYFFAKAMYMRAAAFLFHALTLGIFKPAAPKAA